MKDFREGRIQTVGGFWVRASWSECRGKGDGCPLTVCVKLTQTESKGIGLS